LRKRSFGPNLFPEHITSGHELAPLYAILFGLHGALPVLAIAITFAALLRIVRLTEVRWPYTTGMIGLVAIAIWPLLPHFPLLQLWNVVEFIQPRPMEAVFRESHIGAFFALILWLLAAFVMAAGSRKTKTIMYEAELVRVGMLGFPMIILLATSYLWDFIFLIEWRVAWYFFVSWVLAVAEILLVIAIVQRLDIEMVELNCRPRLN
jgi:hypothetical protein